VSGKKNVDRSLKRMARKHVRDAQRAMRNLRLNKEAACLRGAVLGIESDLACLLSGMKEECQYCSKKVEFGFTTCAGCADERGP